MSKQTITVEEDFKKIITTIGYNKTLTQTSSEYFVNPKGNQIRIDKNGYANVLNNKGYVLKSSKTFTLPELVKFANL